MGSKAVDRPPANAACSVTLLVGLESDCTEAMGTDRKGLLGYSAGPMPPLPPTCHLWSYLSRLGQGSYDASLLCSLLASERPFCGSLLAGQVGPEAGGCCEEPSLPTLLPRLGASCREFAADRTCVTYLNKGTPNIMHGCQNCEASHSAC